MTEGKLVRDLIPEIIRKSGRHAKVQYLSGVDLAGGLVAKLCEEAAEVKAAIGDRASLVDELADLTEVMSALMTTQGIQQQEVLDAAERKASRRGRYETGAWLINAD